MAEYIDRAEYCEKYCRCSNEYCDRQSCPIWKAPTADVAPVVHARWIPSESDFDDDDTLFDGEECCDWQCSACREDICYEDPMPMKLLPNCCPKCGAKMDEEDGGADHDA